MQDTLDAKFEDLGQLVDRWQRTSSNYNRAMSIIAFLAGGAFALLMMEAITELVSSGNLPDPRESGIDR